MAVMAVPRHVHPRHGASARRCAKTAAALALLACLPPLRPAASAGAASAPAYTADARVDRLGVACGADGIVRVRWHSSVELGMPAFEVLRRSADNDAAAPVRVGKVCSRGQEEGAAYELADPGAAAKTPLRYELRLSGADPASATLASWTGTPSAFAPQALAAPAAAPAAAPLQTWIGGGTRVLTWTDSPPADRVRLSLREEGVYRVSAQELGAAMGADASLMTAAMAATNLALSCQGRPVAWLAEGTNLYFYGLAPASRYAPENVYWVAFGSGTVMSVTNVPMPSPVSTNASFPETLTFQGTTYIHRLLYSSLADSPDSFLAFDFLLSHESLQITEALPDVAPGPWTGAATASLLSFCEDAAGDSQAAQISLGGTVLGSTNWPGEQCVALTCPFASTNLSGSNAILTVANTADEVDGLVLGRGNSPVDLTWFALVSCRFAYQRQYRAQAGWLRCTGGTGNVAAVSGFATNDALVLDVSVPERPAVVASSAPSPAGGLWTAAFPAGGTDCVYAVFSRRDGVKLPAVRGVRDVDWRAASNAMDYAMLVPPEAWRTGFRQALQPLADFRTQQGLGTRIIDVESIYNRFSDGLVDPAAIRAFCGAGRTNWGGRPLRYLLLAGAGSLDFQQLYRSVNDITACLIPTVPLGQRFATVVNSDGSVAPGGGIIVAADHALGDIDDDGVPEVAIGRLPTTSLSDVTNFVNKTRAYEGALPWKRQAVLAADWNNTGAKYCLFDDGVDRLVAPVEAAGRTVLKDYLHDDASDPGASAARSALFQAFWDGSGLFHFFGHTDELSLGGANRLLDTRNTPPDFSAGRWQKPMVALLVGCRVNRWQSPSSIVCIVPYGLFAANTGFAAGIGPNGYWTPDEGRDFAVGLYSNAAVAGTLRLGDVLLAGLRQSHAAGVPRDRLQCFCLSGDPALVFRHDVTAMGTSAAWLNGFGLTAPDADFGDPDGDGWMTWQEFQAGTSPTNNRLHAAAFALQPGAGRLNVTFDTTATNLYRVQRAPAPGASADWQPSDWAWPTSAVWHTDAILPQSPRTTVAVPLIATNRQEFFRLVTTPP